MGKKLLFFLAWLGIVCIAAFSIVYIVVPSCITRYVQISPFLLETAILGLSVLYILLALYKLFSNFERKKDFEMNTAEGKVVIASSTIHRYVVEVLKRDFPVEGIKVKSSNKGKGLALDLKMSMEVNGNIADAIQAVQAKLIEEIQDKLGITLTKIKVHIQNLSIQNAGFAGQKGTSENGVK